VKDCGSVCEGPMVAAVNCNEIMLDMPSQERISSPGQKYCFCTKVREISVSFAVHKRSHDPSLAPDYPCILRSRNWGWGRVRGLVEWNPYEN